MNTNSPFEQSIRSLRVGTAPGRDREILDRLLRAQHAARAAPTAPGPRAWLWAALRRPRSALAGLASLAVVALLVVFVTERSAPRAWAIEEAVAVLRVYHAVHLVAIVPSGTLELWMRANPAATQSTDVLVHSPGGVVSWTRHGSTFHYVPADRTVYSEPAVTIGMTPWLGPTLLETLARAPGAQLAHGRESLFGRRVVTLIGGLHDVKGPQSWIITFDADTKLPIAFKTWANLDRSGPPAFDVARLTFYEELPPSLFDVKVPANARTQERPLTCPAESVGLLAGPDDGLPADGLDQQKAAELILGRLYQSLIDRDLPQFRRLAPLARLWGDEFLHTLLFAPGSQQARIVKTLEIGPIFKAGHTSLGSIVALPVVTLRGDGTKVRDKIIVQFREIGGRSSCVAVGPYGLPEEVD